MNFSRTQHTGWSSESLVKGLFMSWRWNVAQDEIDAGYDLCVTPDMALYGGLNFYVQVKGTLSKRQRDSMVAKVSKRRLVQYASSETPVFIVRVSADRSMRWIHAQEWARKNPSKLIGDGTAQVALSPNNLMSDRSEFEACLTAALAPRRPGAGAVSSLRDEAQHLRSLDSKLNVRINADESGKSYSFEATGDPVLSEVNFRLAPGEDNAEALRRAMIYGVPARFEAEELSLTGSRIFEKVVPLPIGGTVVLDAEPGGEGTLRFRVQAESAAVLTTSARRFRGVCGAAVNNFHANSLLRIELRITQDGTQVAGSFSLMLDHDLLARSQLRDIDELDGLSSWAEDVLTSSLLNLEADFDACPVPLTLRLDEFERVKPLLSWICHLGRMREIAIVARSNLTVTDPSKSAQEDWGHVRLMQRLLRGEKVAQKVEGSKYRFVAEAAPMGVHDLVVADHLRLTVMDQWLAEVSVRTDLSGYVIRKEDGATYVAEPGPSASAVMHKMDAADPCYSKTVAPLK